MALELLHPSRTNSWEKELPKSDENRADAPMSQRVCWAIPFVQKAVRRDAAHGPSGSRTPILEPALGSTPGSVAGNIAGCRATTPPTTTGSFPMRFIPPIRTLSLLIAAMTTTMLIGTVPTAHAQGSLVERVATGLSRPVFLTAPPGDGERVFIVEQHTGDIRILRLADFALLSPPFLTVPGLSTGEEQGVLGLAFDPDYATNGFFYVYYTNTEPRSRVVRYQVSSGDPDLADPNSDTPILDFHQPQTNHNGGWIGFGPDDDLLYVATGDGGNFNDTGTGHTEPGGNAQDLTSNWLGKILRVDVASDDFPGDPDSNYAIPADNPFVGSGNDEEIWAYGLRNPYRASFDRQTGDFYVGDVGQGVCEELNVQPAASPGGENYGWRRREGTIATPGSVGGDRPPGAIDPIFDYTHNETQTCRFSGAGSAFLGVAITGGYVYRGPDPQLAGRYFFGDFGTGRLWSLVWDGSAPSTFDGTNYLQLTDHGSDPDYLPDVGSIATISSFGEDAAGNLYVLDLFGGEVFRVPEPDSTWMLGSGVALLILLTRRSRPSDRARRGSTIPPSS